MDRGVFFEKRGLRILPLYWAVLLLSLAVEVRSLDGLRGRLGYFLFLQGFPDLVRPMPPFTDGLWSLATEVQFYAVLPLLPACLRTRRRAAVVLVAWVALYVAFLARVLRGTGVGALLHYGVFGYSPHFAAGIAAAWLHRRRVARGAGPILGPGAADLVLVGCLVALAVMLRHVVHDGYFAWNEPPRFAWRIPEGACWAVFLFVLLHGRPLLRPLLVNAPLARLGVVSYSVYLLHLPLLWYSIATARWLLQLPAAWSAGNAAWLGVAILLTIAVAGFTYRYIELPFLRRKDELRAESGAAR